ncbi:MAG: DUF3347 domain-containing protein [Chitinophagaceae bacterium]|nr:MAG: DUF3347 domain-containing protein [Chitinophagaceae bacterium]
MKTKLFLAITLIIGSMVSLNGFGYPKDNTAKAIINAPIASPSDNVFERYNALQNALANDDAPSAQKAAEALATALSDIPGSAAATKEAIAIGKTKDIVAQRKILASLSTAVINLLKAHKPQNVMPYIHYCPMKKAYWMSNSKAIRNPYYGKQMLSCGETTGMIM